MSELNGDKIKKLIELNTRSIEALSSSLAESRREMAALRDTLGHVARTQGNALAHLAQLQGESTAQMYRVINRLDSRQGEIVEIMKLLANKVGESKSEE